MGRFLFDKRVFGVRPIVPLYLIAVALMGFSFAYTVVTGDQLLTDTHYNLAGRIVQAVFGIVAVVIGLRFGRTLLLIEERTEELNAKFKERVEADKARAEEPPPSIDYEQKSN